MESVIKLRNWNWRRNWSGGEIWRRQNTDTNSRKLISPQLGRHWYRLGCPINCNLIWRAGGNMHLFKPKCSWWPKMSANIPSRAIPAPLPTCCYQGGLSWQAPGWYFTASSAPAPAPISIYLYLAQSVKTSKLLRPGTGSTSSHTSLPTVQSVWCDQSVSSGLLSLI